MNKNNRIQKIMMAVCLGTLIFFTATIGIRFFTRQVLIVGMGMDNAFTRSVFFDNIDMQRQPDYEAMVYGDTDDYSYNWSKEYPFDEIEDDTNISTENSLNLFANYLSMINSIKNRVNHYAQEDLLGYIKITEIANLYDSIVNWNFSSFSEYNGVYKLSDGYWTVLKEKNDCSQHISSFVSFSSFLNSKDIDFLYVQAPYKVSKYDEEISGIVDFSNQNADALLDGLNQANIDFLDLRENIHKEGLEHHKLFYITDHHWKGETGLWAAKEITKYLNDTYEYEVNLDLYNSYNFESVNYEKYFLGSLGRKVTLGKAKPEDITLLYPKYDTKLQFEIPSIGINIVGDFSITYNMEALSEIDYYNKDPYHAYSYGDRAIIRYKNMGSNIVSDKKILLIHDSFSDCMQSFLSLGFRSFEALDLRYFNGSLEKYIEENQPDMVIVMYNAGELSNDVDLSTHTNLYDFR